jgi:hypothetical protein
MSPPRQQTHDSESFQTYLQFISDMLGGDLFPLESGESDISSLVSHRAIDYELVRSIVREIQLHNAVFYLTDKLSAYATLDALGALRGQLLRRRGDINQISLIDRIGELTVTFFNISQDSPPAASTTLRGKVYSIK